MGTGGGLNAEIYNAEIHVVGVDLSGLQHHNIDLGAIARRIGELGTAVSPSVLEASKAIYEPFHEREPYRDVRLTRDVAYGAHPRHRLDVFEPSDAPEGGPLQQRPVLLFFHGGGFVGGDKNHPGAPYNDNVALYAVRHGLVGVNVTYRLAPEAGWPAGAEDVAAALAWARANIAAHGGDADQLYLMGTSAGAVHVASYLSHPEFHLPGGAGVAGAILASGAYDLTTFDPDRTAVYLGEDRARLAERSSIRGLVDGEVPVLYVLAEFDPPAAERQALQLLNAYWERHGRWPRFLRLPGHNHFTVTLHLNTPDDAFGRQILAFIEPASDHASPP
ncbi:MAG: alpha/beta hydrolase fold domain-containing protein [Streptosporangiales bacterium]|nr:alpha/beta hydrolase fold domain-containing protein [Streptosporangiales bacterium]